MPILALMIQVPPTSLVSNLAKVWLLVLLMVTV